MKGKIINVWRGGNFGWILGEDGVSYFFNRVNYNRKSTIKVGYLVEFDPSVQEDGVHVGEPEAINIKKTGHGKHHPLACDIQRIGDYIMSNIPDDDPNKAYRLRDVNIIYNYFCSVEDCEKYPNPHKLFMTQEEEV